MVAVNKLVDAVCMGGNGGRRCDVLGNYHLGDTLCGDEMTEHDLCLLVGFFLGIVFTVDVIGLMIIFRERRRYGRTNIQDERDK